VEQLTDYRCPGCGREFEVVWQVTIRESRGYSPVFPPGVRDIARCQSCDASHERTDDGEWRRQGQQGHA
jgi:hypothetical protein